MESDIEHNTNSSSLGSFSDVIAMESNTSASFSDDANDSRNNANADINKKDKVEVKRKLDLGEWVFKKKVKRGLTSEVWNTFGEIRDAVSNEYQGFVQCSKCEAIKMFKPGSSTSPLKSHKCQLDVSGEFNPIATVTVTEEMRNTFKTATVNLCAGDILPYSTFSGPNYINLIQTAVNLGAFHGKFNAEDLVCDPTTVSRAVNAEAQKSRDEIFPQIREAAAAGFCSATTDLWTEKFKNVHFLTVTVHRVTEDFFLENLVLFTKVFPPHLSETAENIKVQMLEEFARLKIPYHKLIFTTDGGANVIKAMSLCGVKRIYCMDHCLNVVLKTTFTLKLVDLNLYGDAGAEVVDWGNAIASYVVATDKKAAQKLNLKQPQDDKQNSRIFKSKLPLLENLLQNFDQITKFLREKGQAAMADALKKEDLSDLITFFKPVEKKAKDKSNSLENVNLDWLSDHIAEKVDDSAFLRELKEHVRKELVAVPILQLLNKCKAIVTYFKQSGNMGLLKTTLKQEVETRWNSHLIMLQSFPKNFTKVNELLESSNKIELKISEEEQASINSLISLLATFKEESDKLERERTPTLHLVYLAFLKLKQHCSPTAADPEAIGALRSHALRLLNEKFCPDKLHKMAIFFWPDFKHLLMLNPEERTEIHEAVRSMCAEYSPPSPPQQEEGQGQQEQQGMNDDDADGYGCWRGGGENEAEDDEVPRYLKTRTERVPSHDVLEWWKNNAQRFPKLAKVSRRILGIPASSAASERTFSTAGNVITCRRTQLAKKSVDDIIFLHKVLKLRAERQKKVLL